MVGFVHKNVLYIEVINCSSSYRAVAPGVLDSELFAVQTLQHIMRVSRTWDSTMSMIPKGGEVIWGGVDWSPEDGYECHTKQSGSNGRKRHDSTRNRKKANETRYGRLISFGNDVAEISKPFKVCN